MATAKSTPVGNVTNFLDIAKLSVDGTTVTGNFTVNDDVKAGVKKIYDNLATRATTSDLVGQVTLDGTTLTHVKGKTPIAYSVDSYVMNTMARYLRALGLTTETPVAKIEFGGANYTFDSSSNAWKNGDTTLVSAIVTAEDSAVRNVTLKLVDANGYSIKATFVAENVDTLLESYGFAPITISAP